MTREELAIDRVRCWHLITRSRRVGFPVPAKWLVHGEPPELGTYMNECLLALYLAPLRRTLNGRSVLLQLLEDR